MEKIIGILPFVPMSKKGHISYKCFVRLDEGICVKVSVSHDKQLSMHICDETGKALKVDRETKKWYKNTVYHYLMENAYIQTEDNRKFTAIQ